MSISIAPADFDSPTHRQAIVRLLDAYASDPDSGGNRPLSDGARARVAGDLAEHPTALVLLAIPSDSPGGEPVGMAVCFEGYGTFAAKPLLNLHDLVVAPDWRGRGVGGALLDAVEEHARRRGCGCVTLEVYGVNAGAQRLYRRHGFVGGEAIDPPTALMFWKKSLE